MLGTESVISTLRMPSVQMDMRPVWIEAPVAQQLGLRDGQVVQATVERKDARVRLWLKDFSFELPNGWVLKDGDKPFLRISHGPSGWGFLIQQNPDGLPLNGQVGAAAVAGATAKPVGLLPPTDPSLISQGNLPHPDASRLGTLLLQPPSFHALAQLLQKLDGRVLGAVAWSPEQADLLSRLTGLRTSMAQINPQTLKRFLSLFFTSPEARLSKQQKVDDEPRSLIRALLNTLGQDDASVAAQGVSEDLHRALNDMEAAQLQSAQDWARGELSMRLMVPFRDAEPVELMFKRPARQAGEEAPPLTVDIHSQSRWLGDIWLNTTIRDNHQVDLVMWASRTDVAEQAQVNASELTYELGAAGLALTSFQIYNTKRPNSEVPWLPPNRGAVVDTQA